MEDDNQQSLINPLENEEQPNNEANESVTNTDDVNDFDEQKPNTQEEIIEETLQLDDNQNEPTETQEQPNFELDPRQSARLMNKERINYEEYADSGNETHNYKLSGDNRRHQLLQLPRRVRRM